MLEQAKKIRQLIFLRGAHRLAHHLKDIRWYPPLAVMQANGYADHQFGAEFPRRARWHRRNNTTVREATRPDLHWLEQSWKCATRANRIRERSLAKDDRIASAEVRGHNGRRDMEILKLLGIEEAPHQCAQPVIAG